MCIPQPSERRQRIGRACLAGLLTLLIGLGACALAPPANEPVADPANPLQLNEAAVASAARGDIEAAWLLLERAARLAPHDARIAANLAALREYRSMSPRGRIAGAKLPDPAARKPPPTARGEPAASPAIWVAK
ncbi:MAG: hypothetical protein OEY03_12670 [Rhizobacter sp.]|nr:hypothetical protein [Rhizobacter sp.]